MTVNRNVTYGDYADGYCEDWAPTGAALFSATGLAFAPARMPGYPAYTMSWEQASEKSSGADTIAYGPYVQELIIQLSWAGMSGADKASLEAFFSYVNGMAGSFNYYNPMTGPTLPVRFASDALPAMTEIAYDRYRVDLALRVDINYPQVETSGFPPALTGNRFLIGAVAMAFPILVRPSTGYGVQKPQTLERNTAGASVIYNKSRLTLQQHHVAMVLDYDGFIRLQAFFFSFTHGSRKQFTWIDGDQALISEGTTNLLTANQSSFETDLAGITPYGNHVLARIIGDDTQGVACGEITSSGAGNGAAGGIVVTPTGMISGLQYTLSFDAKSISGNIFLHPSFWGAAGSDIALTTAWKRYILTMVASTYDQIYFWLNGAGVYRIDGLQVEQKPYATPFTLGTRPDVYSHQPRTVRLVDNKIVVRQTAYNRYTTDFNLVEEI